jgi:hypothetical protein
VATVTDMFGFLPVDRSFDFGEGAIEPLPGLPEKIARIRGAAHVDGFFYPPTVTDRPALLYQLEPSHAIRLETSPLVADFRSGDGGFLMHFAGFLFGFRVQFHDWWFDGRLPMTGRMWSFLRPAAEGSLLSQAYRTWKTWPEAERTRFTNLLYMHGRSASYEWDWEQFTIAYMTLDGCYRMANALGIVSAGGHADRLNALLAVFGMPSDRPLVDDILRLRNGLFHESLWHGGQPGTATRTGIALAHSLRRINDRLLLALAGYRGPYLSIPWWTIGQAPI